MSKEDIEKIKEMIEESNGKIREQVLKDCLENVEGGYEPKKWFSDLLQHGCSSGMVGGMVYYTDTHKFYDFHYDEIEEMREEWEDSTGEKLHPDGDLKNWYAWFAYEEVARQVANEIWEDEF